MNTLANIVTGMLLLGFVEPVWATTEPASGSTAMVVKSTLYFVPPTAITLSDNTIDENQDAGTPVGTLTTSDAEDTDPTAFTYALVAGDGSDDNAQFTITDDQLLSATAFDFETKNSYSVRIETTDSEGGKFQQAFTINVVDIPNAAPNDIELDKTSVAENQDPGTTVGTLTTTDAEDDLPTTFTYALVAGPGSDDNNQFAISGDQLVTAVTFDFETKNSYSVRIKATDSGGEIFEKAFIITVDDVAENLAPTDIALTNTTVAENQDPGTTVGTLTTTDAEDTDQTVFAYALVAGTGSDDNGQFNIINNNELVTTATFDFETKDSYTVRIETTDSGGETFEKSFTITVTDVDENQAPTDITLSANTVAENEAIGTVVGTLTTTDAEDDQPTTFTYALVTGPGSDDNDQFAIDGDQLVTAAMFDFETKDSYSVRIETTDSGGETFEKSFTITIDDIAENEAPTNITLDNNAVAENLDPPATIGTLTTADAEDTDPADFTYALVAGDGSDDNDQFTITDDQLLSATAFDFETKSSYSVRIKTTDSDGGEFEKAFSITVEDVDENQAPTDITLDNTAIAENQPINTPIGKLSTDDPDHTEGFTYTKVAGAGDNDNDAFRIVGDQLSSDQQFDYETQNTYQVRIRTTDPAGATFDKAFTVQVTDVDENQAPTDITLDNNSIAENEAEGSLVGKLSTTDPDNSTGFTYTLTAGAGDTDNASFSIKNNQLLSAAAFDFEAKETYQVRITTTDPGGKTFTEAFTIQVTDVDEIDNLPPTDLTLSNATIAENEPANTEIGSFTVTDPDAEDTHTVTLVEGQGDDDNGRFQIRDNVLFALVSFDFEKRSTYSIRVQGKDPKEATITKVLTITITDTEDDVNQAPTDIILSDTLVDEGQIVNLTVGTFSATDPDPGDTHTFSLVAGEGDDDNAIFSIADGQLLTAQTFDYDTQALYRIRVRADDGKGGSLEKMLTIAVIEDSVPENRAPIVANPLADLTAEEGEAFSFVLPDNTFSDADADDVLTYTFSLADGLSLPAWLAYNAANRTLSGTPPEEAPDSLVLTVTATDAQGASVTDQFTLTISRVTALEDERIDAWVVYPVPADQRRVSLRSPATFGTRVRLRLLDINGRLLRIYQLQKGRSAEYTIELPPTLQAGTYFLEIETSEVVGRKRILLR